MTARREEKPALALVQEGDERVLALNQQYAFLLAGGQGVVLEELADGDLELLGLDAFKLWLAGAPPVARGEKWVPLATAWLRDPRRRSYRRLVFQPDAGRVKPDEYNLWRGFAVEPSPRGSCERLLAHIHENVAQGNDEHARWILGYFAQIVQRPAEKPGTALVFRGAQGVGKSITGEAMGLLLGRHYTPISKREHLIGRFNSHLKRALLAQAEEGFWAGDRAAEGVLKDLVTGRTMLLELKGKEPVEVANHLRLLITSNHEWVVPAAWDERRFAVFDVGEGRRQNRSYFGALWRELTEQGGARRLLEYLQRFDLATVDPAVIPATAALAEQKLHNLDAEAAWLLDVLRAGVLPGDETGVGRCNRTTLHEAYVHHAKLIGFPRRSTETRLGMFLRRVLRGEGGECLLKEERPLVGEGRERVYVFPTLTACRHAVGRALHVTLEWGGPAVWAPWTAPWVAEPKEPWR